MQVTVDTSEINELENRNKALSDQMSVLISWIVVMVSRTKAGKVNIGPKELKKHLDARVDTRSENGVVILEYVAPPKG